MFNNLNRFVLRICFPEVTFCRFRLPVSLARKCWRRCAAGSERMIDRTASISLMTSLAVRLMQQKVEARTRSSSESRGASSGTRHSNLLRCSNAIPRLPRSPGQETQLSRRATVSVTPSSHRFYAMPNKSPCAGKTHTVIQCGVGDMSCTYLFDATNCLKERMGKVTAEEALASERRPLGQRRATSENACLQKHQASRKRCEHGASRGNTRRRGRTSEKRVTYFPTSLDGRGRQRLLHVHGPLRRRLCRVRKVL